MLLQRLAIPRLAGLGLPLPPVQRTFPRKGSRTSVSEGNDSTFKRSCGVKAIDVSNLSKPDPSFFYGTGLQIVSKVLTCEFG
jgi:hypothetical protein